MKWCCPDPVGGTLVSPSMRREWIEISYSAESCSSASGLPPCGGSGLKFPTVYHIAHVLLWSPSMRREWIEMLYDQTVGQLHMSPSMRREWIEIAWRWTAARLLPCLPPCGGSGLKYAQFSGGFPNAGSPSMRREWIEMLLPHSFSFQ